MKEKIIYFVHCVDAEGPLYESLDATFERVKSTFGIDIAASKENLNKLRRGEGLPLDLQDLVSEFVSEKRLNYNPTWDDVERMVDKIMSPKWRNTFCDDFGRGYVFNWFAMDHVGFQINPRRRSVGYHTLYDFYASKIKEHNSIYDEIQWHYHPPSYFGEGHKCSNNFFNSSEHLNILSQRIIDRKWFPSAFRPGQHTERPDINLFLELWIPFDYGNQGMLEDSSINKQKDVSEGRFGDWRRATTEWEIYNPDFYDYQVSGKAKRHIARCLNLNARIRAINEYEVEKGFMRAQEGKSTIISVTDHDERAMEPGIENCYALMRKVQKKYPDVKIKNTGAREAMRLALNLTPLPPISFDVALNDNVLQIKTNRKCWGPQPFFCFKTKGMTYIHENLDYHGGTHWSFTFDENSIALDNVDSIGLATNDEYGNNSIWTKKI